MPRIFKYKCSRCKFKLPEGWGYCFYVESDKGERIPCLHPGERDFVEQALGKRPSLDVVQERTGFNSDCVCLDCLHQFEADLGEVGWSPYDWDLHQREVDLGKIGWGPHDWPLHRYKSGLRQEKDNRECPKCKSRNVKTELEMVGETCPRCRKGVIEEIWTGGIS